MEESKAQKAAYPARQTIEIAPVRIRIRLVENGRVIDAELDSRDDGHRAHRARTFAPFGEASFLSQNILLLVAVERTSLVTTGNARRKCRGRARANAVSPLVLVTKNSAHCLLTPAYPAEAKDLP